MLQAVLITGAPGVGKTAVASELHELLRLTGAQCAMLDLDALGTLSVDAGGTFNSDLIVSNVAALWPNFAAHNPQYLVMARIIGHSDELHAYEETIGTTAVTCRLVAPSAVIAARLDHRETGTAREFLKRISAQVGAAIDRLAIEDFTVENGADRTVTDVAIEILEHLGWPHPD